MLQAGQRVTVDVRGQVPGGVKLPRGAKVDGTVRSVYERGLVAVELDRPLGHRETVVVDPARITLAEAIEDDGEPW